MAKDKSQIEELIEMGLGLELFRSPEGDPYATLESGARTTCVPLKSGDFSRHLRAAYRAKHKHGVNGNSLREAVEELTHHALEHGDVHQVYIRTASHGGMCYLDLADAHGTVIRTDGDGWQVDPSPPVRFMRPSSMQALPMPEPDGELPILWQFLNVPEQDRLLMIACLVALLHHPGPYPVLIFEGGQGSGKSTATRATRRLVDPHGHLVRRKPRDERDVRATLENGYVLAYDNLDRVPDWLSDVFCTLATGGAFGGRCLYQDRKKARVTFSAPYC
jgi:putative DNA primase/helicase